MATRVLSCNLDGMNPVAELKAQVETLPLTPGVYLFRDAAGAVLYVGKAKNIRVRVRHYFGVDQDNRFLVPFLVEQASHIDYFITHNEKEALLLENTLIKQHQPRYNIELKDDKNYLCLRLDLKQPFPRVEMVRRKRPDGALYFGPFHSAIAIRQTVRLLNRHFQLRTCKDTVFKNRQRPCLQYEIKRCPGPCVFDVDHEDYRHHVNDAVAFLEGKASGLLGRLHQRMRVVADEEDFERAALYRDQINAIEQSLTKQRVNIEGKQDRDIFAMAREGHKLVLQLLYVREGQLRGGRTFDIDNAELPTSELLEDAVRSYYDQTTELPREVWLSETIEGINALEEWLRDRCGHAVDVLVPERGEKRRLIELAQNNALYRLRTRVDADDSALVTLEALQRALNLQNFPERIECYDISNTQGGQIVGSQVVFENGFPAKAEYRLYRMKAVPTQDDFLSLREMLTRRLKRGLEEGELPSLIVIDGGLGQLNIVRAVFDELGIEGVDLCSLAKSRVLEDDQNFAGAPPKQENSTIEKNAIQRSPERIFLPGRKNPVILKPYATELHLLMHIRDEAHRFAIGYHRKLRTKRGLVSALDGIFGIGPKRKKALLQHFGSVKAFLEAPEETLKNIPGIPAHMAQTVRMQLLAQTPPPAPSPPKTAFDALKY